MQLCQYVSDNRLLNLRQPANDVLDIIVASLGILPERESINVGHAELAVVPVVVMDVRDGLLSD